MNRQESTLAPQSVSHDSAPGGASPHAQDRSGPSGLGGWLTVVGLWLVFTVLTMCWGWGLLYESTPLVFIWKILTDLEAQLFTRVYIGLGLIEMTVVSIASVVALYGFFRRARWLPRLLIGFVVVYLVLEVVITTLGVVANASVLGDFELNSRLMLELARTLAYPLACVLILVPYLLRSRRVRNTFVRAPVR